MTNDETRMTSRARCRLQLRDAARTVLRGLLVLTLAGIVGCWEVVYYDPESSDATGSVEVPAEGHRT